MKTPCECKYPGYCSRHGVMKVPHFWQLCRTRDDYFRAWENGRGPGQRIKEGMSPPYIDNPAAREEVERRRSVCSMCENWMGDRCKLIELGCGPAFYKWIADADKPCPEGKW